MRTRRTFTSRFGHGTGRHLAGLAVGLLALFINIAAGGIAAQQQHRARPDVLSGHSALGEISAHAQLAADLAILCAPDGTTLLPAHPGNDHSPGLPHCQSCLPFFALALAPPLLDFDVAFALLTQRAQAPVHVAPTVAAARPSSTGARGPPLA